MTIVTAICTVAGVGGGGVINPLISFCFSFKTDQAIAISSFILVLTALTRFLYYMRECNPKKPHTIIIDYSLATVMMPATLAGSQIGSYFLTQFPTAVL